MKYSINAILQIILIILFQNTAHATYQWVDEKGILHISDVPKPNQESMGEDTLSTTSEKSRTTGPKKIIKQPELDESEHVKSNNLALKKMIAYGDPDKKLIWRLIQAHDFQSLDRMYEKMLQQYKIDEQYESFLDRAYDIRGLGLGVRIQDLDEWVASTRSYVSYAIRGIFKTELGFDIRGARTINETPSRDLETMQQLHNEAAKDLQEAISKNPSIMPAYSSLISTAMASDMPFTPYDILQKALEVDRRTFTVRLRYLMASRPRWGGSFDKMSEFARQEIEYANLNPRLWSLQGDVKAEIGLDYYRKDNYKAAIDSFSDALTHGDRIFWLERRALAYDKIGQKDKSAADIERIRLYQPNYQPDSRLFNRTTAAVKTIAFKPIELVTVKGGCFEMGNTFGDDYLHKETPHQVCVDSFALGKYPVTQDQWQSITGNNPVSDKQCGGGCPVVQVSWNDIQEFIEALNKKTGKHYRLPTEAEWEYAARSGGKAEKWSGTNDESMLADYTWYNANSNGLHPVGQKKPNGLGIYEMGGSIREWVADWYGDDYYGNSPKNNPQGPLNGSKRVLRGGCMPFPQLIRTSKRCSDEPDAHWTNEGFRLASPIP